MGKLEDRFILVETFKDNSIKTIIADFNTICNEIEYQLDKIEKNSNDYFGITNAVVYDRQYSSSDLDLNCYYEVYNRVLYSQFIDSYFA